MRMEKKQKWLTSSWGVALGATLCCALWGSAFPGIKIGYQLFKIPAEAAETQILFAGLRFTLAGLMTILITSLLTRRPAFLPGSSWGMVGKLSIFQTILQYLFFYIGLAHASGVKSSIISGSNVFLAILISCCLFRQERLTRRKLFGCLLGFAGVVLVNWNSEGLLGGMRWNGEGFIFLSAVSYAISSALIKTYSAKESPMALSGWQFTVGGLFMILAGLLLGGRIPAVCPEGIAVLFYLGLVSAVAYSLWAVLLKYNSVSRVAVFGFMNPVFGVLLSALLLQEGEGSLGWKTFGALILVCAGIWTVNRKE